MTQQTAARSKSAQIVYIALFAVLIAVCSWISIPSVVPFTLQTFAVFLAVGLLGGKRGTASVVVYIVLGVIGLPVFAGFSGGIGRLLGPTGGYIIGFIFLALLYWLITSRFGTGLVTQIVGMVIGLAVLYAFGTAWFVLVYSQKAGTVGLLTALGWCVFPFILPDLIKLVLAVLLSRRLSKHVHL